MSRRDKVVLGIMVVVALFLIGCSVSPASQTVRDGLGSSADTETVQNVAFNILCDQDKSAGMFTYAAEYDTGGTDYAEGYGWGFAVRMTEDEYARYCVISNNSGENNHGVRD